MSKVRYGGFIFQRWVGDHPPGHVHVHLGRRVIGKWNLEEEKWLEDWTPRRSRRRIERLIRDLREAGRL